MHFVGGLFQASIREANKKTEYESNDCYTLFVSKRMRGLATFSLFHILLSANVTLSFRIPNRIVNSVSLVSIFDLSVSQEFFMVVANIVGYPVFVLMIQLMSSSEIEERQES